MKPPKSHLPTAPDLDLMASQLAEALDPSRLALRCGIPRLDDWQRSVLTSNARRKAINVSRQGGKSTTAALAVLHRAIYKLGSTSLIVSAGERQAFELKKRISQLIQQMPNPPQVTAEGQAHLVFGNSSRVVCSSPSQETLRGWSIDGIVIADEFARMPDPAQTLAAITPMTSVAGGDIWVISTPAGLGDKFHEIMSTPNNGFEKWTVPATSIPRISPEFLQLERRAMNNDALWSQEFMCSFESPDATTVFDASEVLAVFNDHDEDDDAILIPEYREDPL